MPIIDFDRLEQFVVLANSPSVSAAAAKLSRSQPALSRSIMALERAVGARLFDRGRAGVNLTPIGRQILERVAPVVDRVQAVQRDIREIVDGQADSIRVGLGTTLAGSLTRSLVDHVREVAPHARLSIEIAGYRELASELKSGNLDFFLFAQLGPLPASDRAWFSRDLLATAFPRALVRPGHPLLGREQLSEQDLASYPIGSGTGWNTRLRESGESADDLVAGVEIDNFEILMRLAATSDLVVVATSQTEPGGLVPLAVRLSPRAHEVPIYAFTLRDRSLSGLAASSLAVVKPLLAPAP